MNYTWKSKELFINFGQHEFIYTSIYLYRIPFLITQINKFKLYNHHKAKIFIDAPVNYKNTTQSVAYQTGR